MTGQKSFRIFENEWHLIFFFAGLKVLVHLLTYDNFELHRDAYLYYAQGEHLTWGYVASPPSIAAVGKLATAIFGNTTFGLRLFPALIGGVSTIIIGKFVKDLGGRHYAIALAALAYILSPSYLHTNALFQPVAFNHTYWILSLYLFFKLIKTQQPTYWLWIGLAFGFGFLNKYSIVFLYAALGSSLILTSQRKLFVSKYFLWGSLIGLLVITPNLLWQYNNNWPILHHMDELRRTQLVHVTPFNFIFDQLLMNAHVLLLWVAALGALLFYRKEKAYRLFGLVYIVLFTLILAGSGKSYYTLGVYPMLFVFGAYFIEKYFERYLRPLFLILVVFMGVGLYISLSFDGIPFISFEQAVNKGAFRWEDGKQYDIPQDMSDMTGWKEIGETVADLYVQLGPENQNNCEIFTYHYGQGGAVMFYGKKSGIPQPIAPTGSFVFWAPDQLTKDYVIYIHSDLGNQTKPDSLLPTLFEKVTLKKVIDNKYFRENGTRIYLCENPNDSCRSRYANLISGLKSPFKRE